MQFQPIYGQSALWEALFKSLSAGAVAHAFLLVGPRGSGKKTAALWLAAAALCKGPIRPCLDCGTCRRVFAGHHPDVQRLKISEASKSRSIGVDAVRDLLKSIAQRSYEGGGRVVIVEEAHRMTVQAQNAFLKSLEEQVGDTLFLLLAEQMEPILPTIRSRCGLIRMGRLPFSAFEKALLEKGVEKKEIPRLYDLSDGILGRALEIWQSVEYREMESLCGRLIETVAAATDIPQASMELSKLDKPSQELFLEIFENKMRNLLLDSVMDGQLGAGFAASRGFTSIKLHSIIKEVVSIRKRLDANVTFVSAVEPLLWALIGG